MNTDPEHHDEGDQVASVHYLPAAIPDGEPQQSNAADRDQADLVGPVLPGEVVEEVVDAELVDDGPRDPSVWRPPVVERRPVVAPWLRQAEQRKAAARWAAGHVWHCVKWHTARMPWVALRLAAHSPRGMARALSLWGGWLFDREAHALRMAAVSATDFTAYQHLTASRNARVKIRLSITGAAVVLAMVGLVVTEHYWPPAQWVLLALALAAFGVAGARQADRPIITPARVTTNAAPRLTPDVVARALGALGIGEINKAIAKGPGVSFAGPITRDGPGWRSDVDLPHGVTAADVVSKRAALASGLRRPLGCVWPEGVGDEAHAGRLSLWVGDTPLSKQPPGRWPLAKTGAADVFAPLPFGRDPRGRPLALPLVFNSLLVGAIPRQGKTVAVRIVALGAALDPTVELHIFDLKGNGDLDPLGLVAHRFGRAPTDDTIAAAAASLAEVHADLPRRGDVLAGLPKTVCRDGKVTRELSNRKSLRLHPVVIVIDECQEMFGHPEYGADAKTYAEAIIRRGPAAGVILALATQRPDKDSLPTGVSANVSIRFCLRVEGQLENDMILGTSAYRNGLRATTFTSADLGVGYLKGHAPDPTVCRTDYVDGDAAERIAQRARALREDADRLTGYAAGDRPEAAPAVDLLAAVAGCYLPGEDRLWTEVILARLAEAHPAAFTGWSPATLAGALRPFGLSSTQVWGSDETGAGRNRNGYPRQAVMTAAMTRRT
jgi:S-DNA-T family DNA segregation ATPase FtsK/SpoIIIE